jgi:hypothetical protein
VRRCLRTGRPSRMIVGYSFANVSFTKGGFEAGVRDNGTFPNGDILSLARTVYKTLP